MAKSLLKTLTEKIPEIPTIIISDSEDESSSTPSTSDSDKRQSPELQEKFKPVPITPATSEAVASTSATNSRKRKRPSSKRRVNRIPCLVCNGRYASRANLDQHMELHWDTFNKMEALLHRITNRIVFKHLLIGKCDCPRCYINKDGDVKKDELRFCCEICEESFPTANKLSKHMDKHRKIYYKMKKLETTCPMLFYDCSGPVEGEEEEAIEEEMGEEEQEVEE